jgi:hypothetical protein
MNRIETVSPNLTRLRQRLEDWRQQRSGRRRIPEQFWTEALALARTEGVSRVSRLLRLPYRRLKDHRNAASSKLTPVAAPAFVELPLPSSLPGGPECWVEMTHRTGAKMTIHLSAASAHDLQLLAQAFWSQRR